MSPFAQRYIPLLPQPISPTLLSFLKLVAFSLYLCKSDINGMFVVVGFFPLMKLLQNDARRVSQYFTSVVAEAKIAID